jgi:hypothetical protein
MALPQSSEPPSARLTEPAISPRSGAEPLNETSPATPGVLPPVLIYLPSLSRSVNNSATRIAQLMAIKMSRGPGSFAAEELVSPSKSLTDGRRIVKVADGPMLDVYMLDYRPRLQLRNVAVGEGVGAAVRRFMFALWYFLRALTLVLPAGKRAKRPLAKWQLVIGFGATVILLLSVVFTVLAVLAALGIWQEPIVAGNAAAAVALGFTAFTTWFFFNARPSVNEAAARVEEMITYAQNERHAAGVTSVIGDAIDDLLKKGPSRSIHLFGYSFGALVAMDFMHPRISLFEPLDARHQKAIRTLVTVGLPLDFVRLYVPRYIENREARVDNLHWTNVYIPADVFGSNLVNGDDVAEAPPGTPAEAPPGTAAASRRWKVDRTADRNRLRLGRLRLRRRRRPAEAISIAGQRPVSHQYTSERLTFFSIWGGRGFFSHGGYWDEPENENCLHLVIREVLG